MLSKLKTAHRQLVRAQEEERKRIARELHDDTAQELLVISRWLDLTSAEDYLPEKRNSYIEELRQKIAKVLDGVRRFSQDLRPSILDDLGLIPSLEWLISDLSQNFGVDIAIAVLGKVRRFPPEVELTLFRIAQEALRNVCKHSKASKAWINIEFGATKTALTIQDNGKGFNLSEKIEDLAITGKLGLIGMQERALLIDGKLTIRSEPGKGTTVIIEILN